MISPIQQNVAFKGAQAINSADNFKGGMSQSVNVRDGYANAVNKAAQISQTQNMNASSALGENLNTIA